MYCKECFCLRTEEGRAAALADEVRALEEEQAELARTKAPTGAEPALQLLILPQGANPLPSYERRAEYLAPTHCRLCFKDNFDEQFDEDFAGSESVDVEAVRSGRDMTLPGSEHDEGERVASFPCGSRVGGACRWLRGRFRE